MAGTAWVGSWSPGIAPRVGLVAVPFYLLGAWRCARLARGRGIDLAGGEAICWWILSAILLALGIYKLFDLQTALAELGRTVASEHRWYARRRPVQLALVLGLGLGSAVAIVLAVWLARKAPPPTRLASVGGVALVGFVAIRTISFHAIDLFLDAGLAGLKANWVIELGGIVAILVLIHRRAVHRGR
jgi:hypothetical protein